MYRGAWLPSTYLKDNTSGDQLGRESSNMGPIFAESLKVIFHLVSFVVRVKISDVGANKSSARYVAKGSDAPPSFLCLENLKNSVMCCLMTSLTSTGLQGRSSMTSRRF